MPNYCPKGTDYMKDLARRGGLKSGETRRYNRDMRRIAGQSALIQAPDVVSALIEAGVLGRENRSGGSHDTDWRCPACHHFNSIHSRACAKCKRVSPGNGRLTRAELRERIAGHRYAAILRKADMHEV
jgi:hypothetical protein